MKVRGPFSVNAAAIMAGVAALEDLEFQKNLFNIILNGCLG